MDSRMHRRKSSKEDALVDTSPRQSGHVTFPVGPDSKDVGGPSAESSRARVNSVPSPSYHRSNGPPSAGPHRTSFTIPNHNQPPSPFRPAFSHSRSFSGSTFASSSKVPAPLAPPPRRSFSGDDKPSSQAPNLTSSAPSNKPLTNGSPPSPTQVRRHGRIHSRNLSIFFPRPGSLPTSSIAEDESQESSAGEDGLVSIIPSASQIAVPTMQKPPGRKRFGDGFTFGGKATSPSNSNSDDGDSSTSPVTPKTTRRVHRHKKSMSHNFFSFLEPGANAQSSSNLMATQWETSQPPTPIHSPYQTVQHPSPPLALVVEKELSQTSALATTIIQFLLGSSLWVSGQQNGSLGCTGLGYWVVFDSFGMALTHLLPSYLSTRSMRLENRRSYGNDRIETLALFAQTIYLIFASVYVCKETVEHVLLSLGDGHHHHRMDEGVDGIQFPTFLFLLTSLSLLSTCLFYGNHANLLKTSGHRLPSSPWMTYFTRFRSVFANPSQASPISTILANPFTLTPLLFTTAMLIASVLLPASQHRPFDLLVAALETMVTFSIAYPAAVVQGAVLLQTAPTRGLPGGRMEGFLRTMREIERHPLVLHLPAPHMWELTPSPAANDFSDATKNKLVVTIELHVRKDLDDNEVLSLTRWAHDRVRLALNLGSRSKEHDDDSEVTVGIVRG